MFSARLGWKLSVVLGLDGPIKNEYYKVFDLG